MYTSFLKRCIDLIVSLLLLLLLLPLLLFTAFILGFHFKGSPFFLQKRIGLAERSFLIVKFKTMRDIGYALPDEARITKLGKWLRRTRWDECPQLWNVIIGDMSLVGPRPLLPEYLSLYSTKARTRHQVKPGITGLAQLYGASSLNWERRFNLDVLYVKKISPLLDLRICLRSAIFLVENKEERNIGPYRGVSD